MRIAQKNPPNPRKPKAAARTPEKKVTKGSSAKSAFVPPASDIEDDLNIVYDEFMPEWNYTIYPRTKK